MIQERNVTEITMGFMGGCDGMKIKADLEQYQYINYMYKTIGDLFTSLGSTTTPLALL